MPSQRVGEEGRQGMWLRGGWVVPVFVLKKADSFPRQCNESLYQPLGEKGHGLQVILHSLRHRKPGKTSHSYTLYVYRTLRSGHSPEKKSNVHIWSNFGNLFFKAYIKSDLYVWRKFNSLHGLSSDYHMDSHNFCIYDFPMLNSLTVCVSWEHRMNDTW